MTTGMTSRASAVGAATGVRETPISCWLSRELRVAEASKHLKCSSWYPPIPRSKLEVPADVPKLVFAKTSQISFGEPPLPYEHTKDHGKDRIPIVVFLVDLLTAFVEVA